MSEIVNFFRCCYNQTTVGSSRLKHSSKMSLFSKVYFENEKIIMFYIIDFLLNFKKIHKLLTKFC